MIFSGCFPKALPAARTPRVGKEFYFREAKGARAIIGIFSQASPTEQALRWEEKITQDAPKRANPQRFSHQQPAIKLGVSSFAFL